MTCVLPSLYEHLYSLCTIGKQRFVEHFSGDIICASRWTTTCIAGANTFQMSDGPDQGFEAITATCTGDGGAINYGGATNSPLHFAPASFKMIAVYQSTSTVTRSNSVGMSVSNLFGACNDFFAVVDDTSTCFVNLSVNSGACPITTVDTCCTFDACFHVAKFVGTACCITLALDEACVTVTASCDLPDTPLAPNIKFLTRTTAARTFRYKYLEAYGT